MATLPGLAHGGHDAHGLPGLDDAHDLVWLCGSKVRFHELVASLLGVLQEGESAAVRIFLHPPLVLGGDLHQILLVDREQAPALTEESHGSRSIQKAINACVQYDAVEARLVHRASAPRRNLADARPSPPACAECSARG